MAATVDSVRTFLGIGPTAPADDAAMASAVAAANSMVATWRPDLAPADPEPWNPRAEFAANLQAARLYARRGSVQGVAAFADVGVTMIPRLDPDVRSTLELGEYQPSVVA